MNLRVDDEHHNTYLDPCGLNFDRNQLTFVSSDRIHG